MEDEERTFLEPEEELIKALEGLQRTEELTRRNRAFLREIELPPQVRGG